MAFWKKSEDPWDIDPEKKRRGAESCFALNETEEDAPHENFLSGLFKRKEVSAEEEAPVPCPYCGETMKKGYLKGGRDSVYWTESKPGFFGAFDEAQRISTEGGLFTAPYRTGYLCESCRKLIVDVPPPTEPNYVWDGENVRFPDEEEEERHDL